MFYKNFINVSNNTRHIFFSFMHVQGLSNLTVFFNLSDLIFFLQKFVTFFILKNTHTHTHTHAKCYLSFIEIKKNVRNFYDLTFIRNRHQETFIIITSYLLCFTYSTTFFFSLLCDIYSDSKCLRKSDKYFT